MPDTVDVKLDCVGNFLIVGIGASAGGLRAIEEFFDNMPSNSGAAFVLVQHLSPDYKSLMVELLARHTNMAIQRVTEDMPIAPDTIFLIPPSQDLVIEKGHFRLTQQDRDRDCRPHFPIDIFLRSLAIDCKERAIGIILSGTGSDGTRGIKYLSEKEGIVLVQDPATAEFDGMPRSAIATGLVDLVLSPTELAQTVYQFVSSPTYLEAFKEEQESHPNSAQLQQIVSILKRRENIDFTHYKTSTISRRTQRRCLISGHEDLGSYMLQLESSEEARHTLRNDLLITVTRFFRNPTAWKHLEEVLLPELIAQASPEKPIRVWVTACATGEEAYSIAILLQELLDKQTPPISAKVFATDIDQIALDKASSGVFPASIANDLSPARLERFFNHRGSSYEVSRSLRDMIIFANHNLVTDASFTNMNLVSCRNVLIYMQADLQQRVLRNLHFALNKGGTLFLGESENLGDLEEEFEPWLRKWKLYQKLRAVRLPMPNESIGALRVRKSRISVSSQQKQPRFDPLVDSALKALLTSRQATCFLVDRHNNMLHLCGDVLRLLRVPEGKMSNEVTKMVPQSLQLPLNTALHRARQKRLPVKYGGCRLDETDANTLTVSLEVSLQTANQGNSQFLMVTIEPETSPSMTETSAKFTADEGTAQYILQLEQQLQKNRENLQATIEELETTNEEQQSTNEELIASNEELQSTNEELHSVNEELNTVNSEYQSKIQELLEVNNDLDNLFKNIDVGVIFLDSDLKIRKFTPAATAVFNLVDADINRPLQHISHNLNEFELLALLESVKQSSQPAGQELKMRQQETYFALRVCPYLLDQKTFDGLILTFVDISDAEQAYQHLSTAEGELRESHAVLEQQVKERTAALEDSQQLLQSISQGTPSVIYVYDMIEKRNVFTNDFVERILGYTSEDLKAMGSEFNAHLFHPEEFTRIQAHHGVIRQSTEADGAVFDLEYQLRDAAGEWRWFYSRETVFAYDDEGKPSQILGAAVDISDRKATELKLKESEVRYRKLYEDTPVMMHSIDPQGCIISVSNYWLQTLGYKREDVLGRKTTDFLTADSRRYAEEVVLPQYMETGICNDIAYNIVCKDGTILDISLSATAAKNEAGKVIRSRAVMVDVTQKNKNEAELARYKENLEELVNARANELKENNERLRSEAQKRQKAQARLTRRARDLERSNADLEQFAYVISHDLQEPLRAMTVFSQLLDQQYAEQLDATAKGFITHVVEGGMRMQALIDGILAFSRVTHRQKTFESTSLEDSLKAALDNIQAVLAESKAQVTHDVLPILDVDGSQIIQLFQNLIGNAIKFRAAESPDIHITAEQRASHWLFSVQDNGIGISEDQQKRIFELFQRLHTRQERDGHGIGLAICKKIVQRHYGEIWIESQPGSGTTFYFTLSAQVADHGQESIELA